MRAWRLLSLLVVITSGCCSTHRAWLDGYSACVPECGSCDCGSGGFLGHKSCLFQKKSHSHCGCNISCDPCGSCGDCFSDCGSPFTGCSSCSGEVMWDGTAASGCSSCAQGQTVYNGSQPSSGGCPHCMQNQMMSPPVQMQQQPAAPAPPAIPAIPPAEPAPEPHKAQLQQLQMIPTQPVQYQEASPPVQQSAPASSYNPPASSAVQPVLWVPAVPSTPAPLMIPSSR